MSLTVPTALLEAAKQGEVDDAGFVGCVRDSLPSGGMFLNGLRRRRTMAPVGWSGSLSTARKRRRRPDSS